MVIYQLFRSVMRLAIHMNRLNVQVMETVFLYSTFATVHPIVPMGTMKICVFAQRRPPVEETASFLQSLLASHGPNYLEKLFGSKARDALAPLGGVEKVAIALSESQTIEDFGAALHLMRHRA
uniref:Uncharacterized protein n=1 Tax=Anopheles maculatus TaxID=74869 RepID=A0A182S975_9DIPT